LSVLLFANNASTTLSGPISTSSNSVGVSTGSGALFPSPVVGQYFVATIQSTTVPGQIEVVWVTARTGDTLTVVRAQEGTSAADFLAGDIFEMRPTAGQMSAMLQKVQAPQRYSYDLGSPPGADIFLNPGDSLALTFASVASVPLYTQTTQGFYRISFLVTNSNTTNADLTLSPNNTTDSNAFSNWVIEGSDQSITGFGSATAQNTMTAFTSGAGFGWVNNVPVLSTNYLNYNSFFIDLFYGPVAGDNVNDIGPHMFTAFVSTYTAAKVIQYWGGITGGPSIGYMKWSDTVTAWTSLGTISIGNSTANIGVVLIERLT
jgi:hypothetical protein